MKGFTMDLRHALRQFWVAPVWSATVVAVLTLGIGSALATFMLVDSLLFRPLGIADQEHVVKIAASRDLQSNSSYPAYLEYRDRSDAFAGVIAWGGLPPMHWRQSDGSRLRVHPSVVSGNFFGVLGVSPSLGRALGPDDDKPAAPPVAVLSDAFWKARFNGRSDVLGRELLVDDKAFVVVGVMPADFHGLRTGTGPELWLPIATGMSSQAPLTTWSWHMFDVYARLKPGVSTAQADAQVDAIAAARDEKKIDGKREQRAQALDVFPLAFSAGEPGIGRTAWLLLGGAILILLTACANATGLLLVRGERRRGELAIRASLGADGLRLARQLLVESLTLTLAGAGIGLLLATLLAAGALRYGAAESVLRASTEALPALPRAGAVALFLALAVAAVSGLLPALRPRSLAVVEELKAGGGSGGGRRWRVGRALVGTQFALTVVLVIGAGLLLRSLWEIWTAPLGVAAMDARVLRLDYSTEELDEAALGDARSRLFLESMKAAPGVAAVGIAAMAPVSDSSMSTAIKLPDRSDGATTQPEADYNPISAGFFNALAAPLAAGRDFGPGDVKGAAPVAIVSQTLARHYFPGVDPIGRHIDTSQDGSRVLEIVGVAPDVKLGDVNEPWHDVVYVPYEQRTFGGWFEAVVRPQAGADAAAQAAVARSWRAIEPNRAVPSSSTMDERVSDAIATPRFMAATLGAFAILALVLAATGIYGAFAFWVSVRQRELGLRLALGANSRRIFTLVLGDGLRVIAFGAMAGVAVSFALGQVIGSVLIGVSPYDGLTYLSVLVLVSAAGLVAAALPARSAANIDPQRSLRCE